MRGNPGAMTLLLVACGLGASCGGGGGADGGGDAGYPGVWQYQAGSFSFVNCGVSSTTVPLARSGFVIVAEPGKLVRINPDGCRFTIVQTTARHAQGVAGEECTVNGTDALGNPMTSHFTLASLVLELEPGGASQMIEVFSLHATNTTSALTYDCEISGNNTLDRAP